MFDGHYRKQSVGYDMLTPQVADINDTVDTKFTWLKITSAILFVISTIYLVETIRFDSFDINSIIYIVTGMLASITSFTTLRLKSLKFAYVSGVMLIANLGASVRNIQLLQIGRASCRERV